MIVLIDNYDSFAFNLVHYFGELGAEVEVHRNDKVTSTAVIAAEPDAIVLSPGPCTPNEAGICLDLIATASPRIPILGVCLGHQAIGQVFGGKVVRAPVPVHGKLSEIKHNGSGVFRGINGPFQATRYHSLVVERASLPGKLIPNAETGDGLIMGMMHESLRVRGETVDEITGAVTTMRAKMLSVKAPADAVDVVGTGGDASGSYNISTCAAFIVAGCGVPVAKHGNRALSSKSGAADVLQALGVKIDLAPADVARCIAEAGIGFMFAPAHHPAMKNVGPTRVELGTRTIFNLLGPLSNPAGVKRQMVGVVARQWIEPLAQVLKNLGSEGAWVVHGSDGLDEITISGPTYVAALENGAVRTFEITPDELGLPRVQPEALRGGSAKENAQTLIDVLKGKRGAFRDVAVLNAAAALMVAARAKDLKHALALAQSAIDSGEAAGRLQRLVAVSNA